MNTDEHGFKKDYLIRILGIYKGNKSFTSSSSLFKNLCLSVFICGLILLSSCNYLNNKNTNTNTTTFEVPKAKINLEKPLEISEQPEDVELCKKIDQTLDDSEFSKARWGIFMVSLKDARVLCGRDGQKLFTPASVEKLLTAIVALDKLGEDFRWKTSVYADGEFNDGVIEGDMILYGRGAADFDDAAVGKLVSQLKTKGLKEITGDIIGDESYFKGDDLGDGWAWNEVQWYYGAAASALSINRNQANVVIENGKPKSDSKYVEVSGEIKPIEDIEAVGLKRELGTNKVFVWGNGKSLDVRVAINNPPLLSAKILKEILEQNGIKVSGEATSRNWTSENKFDADGKDELAFIESETLAETVKKMNKDSVNLYAELILRTLGKKFGVEAPDENAKINKLRGDDLAGASYIKKWLNEQNIGTDEIKIHDGSGLSRLNNLTPEAIGRGLIYAADSKFADIFKNSLPVAGQSGTLKGRLGNVSGKIMGKTGSITYVNSLAGYAERKNEVLAFVIIGNNLTKSDKSSEVIDKIATSLVE